MTTIRRAIVNVVGSKDRVIPIGERALAWVEKYLVEVRPQLVAEPDPGFAFLTVEGEALHPDSLSALARGYVEKSGIKKRGACHLFVTVRARTSC